MSDFIFDKIGEDSNKNYLLSLWEILSSSGICSDKKPEPNYRSSSKPGLTRTIYRFKTYTYADLNWIHSLFYIYDHNTNKLVKVVPHNIEDL